MKKTLDVETHFIDGIGWVVRCSDAVRFVDDLKFIHGIVGAPDAAETDYERGYREGYERRHAEMLGALA